MAPETRVGYVFNLADESTSGQHYHIVISEPDDLGKFAVVSLTDARYAPYAEVWRENYKLCECVRLGKPSSVAARFAKILKQSDLEAKSAEFTCRCTAEALRRARCNALKYVRYMEAEVREHVSLHEAEWVGGCQ